MCGIVGYTGSEVAHSILLSGLYTLEYRGYDSAGAALQEAGGLRVVRRIGKVSNLAAALEGEFSATCGIAHTRWATHGRPSEANAHPHVSCDGKVAVCHNGIIENHADLRRRLEACGHAFRSDTDTEVVAHLVEEYYRGDLLSAVRAAARDLAGSYALAVVHADEPGAIVAARKDSPLVVGHADGASYAASDAIAIAGRVRELVVLGDGQFARLEPGGMAFCDADGVALDLQPEDAGWDLSAAERGKWPDFMLKEIHEQPRVIRDVLKGRISNGIVMVDDAGLDPGELAGVERVAVVACGTSYHAGLIAKRLIERWARVPVEVEVASEYRYRNPIVTPSTLVVAVSQSGETADTIAAVRDARLRGARVLGITNAKGSSVERESDAAMPLRAGKEVAVASTKCFTAQVATLMLLSMALAQARGRMGAAQARALFRDLSDVPGLVESVLSDTGGIDRAAWDCSQTGSMLYIGRGMAEPVCMEGALKLKEISYVHAEAYAAGEMKHGPIALLQEGFPVVAVATEGPLREKTVSNIQECRARGARIVAIATEGDGEIRTHADHVLYIPRVRDELMPLVASVPLQLFARAVALERGCEVDRPRNLAKSVTVE